MLGETDGYDVLRRFLEEQPEAKIVLMTGYESAAGALEATSIGAYEYLVKPFSVADVISLSDAVINQAKLAGKDKSAENKETETGYVSNINLIGRSPKFVDCLKLVGRVAPTDLPVLITGESGTGKEIVARAIHSRSPNRGKQFVAVNCGAIPNELIESELFGHGRGAFSGANRERVGLWEEADGGTLFLDEITETTSQFQIKILRALQQSEIRRVGTNRTIKIDVRVIAATNRDIEEETKSGNFREDLMYRLNAVTINLPPLRERIEDIPILVEYFARRIDSQDVSPTRFSKKAMEILKNYNWRGNVRELENAVLRAVSISDGVVCPEHLPARILKSSEKIFGEKCKVNALDLTEKKDWLTLAEFQLQYVEQVLEYTDGNKQAAARLLNIDRKTLSRMIKRAKNKK